MRSLLCALFTMISLAAVSSADAQDSAGDVAARTHFEAARLHFERGAYEEARREFGAAYELSHRAELLYNLYLTTERIGDFDAATQYLERYLDEGAPDEERRAALEPRLENLRARRTSGGASETALPPETTSVRREGNWLPAVIAFAVAGAGLVTFAVAGGMALGEDGALANGCGATRTCSDAQLSSLSTLNTVADVGWITAAIAATTGVVLLVTIGLPSDETTTTERISFAPWFAPNVGAGANATVRF